MQLFEGRLHTTELIERSSIRANKNAESAEVVADRPGGWRSSLMADEPISAGGALMQEAQAAYSREHPEGNGLLTREAFASLMMGAAASVGVEPVSPDCFDSLFDASFSLVYRAADHAADHSDDSDDQRPPSSTRAVHLPTLFSAPSVSAYLASCTRLIPGGWLESTRKATARLENMRASGTVALATEVRAHKELLVRARISDGRSRR